MREKDFIDWVLEAAEAHPDQIAITDKKGNRVTYKELREGILSVSYSLRHSIPAKSRILFLVPGNAKNMMKALGIMHAGHSIVIVDPFTSDELFESRVRSAETTHVLTGNAMLTIAKIRKHIGPFVSKHIADVRKLNLPTFTPHNKQSQMNSSEWVKRTKVSSYMKVERAGDPRDAAVIVFTSGTTEHPKGVIQTFESLSSGLQETKERFQIDSTSKVLSEPMTLGLVALTAGAEWIQAVKKKPSPQTFDIWFGTPHDAHQLALQVEKYKTQLSVKTVGVGAGPLYPALIEQIDKHIKPVNVLCVYGMTEILPIAIGNAREKTWYLSEGDYVGKPLKHVEVASDQGEIVVKSVGIAKYINHPDAETLHTGDYGILTTSSTGTDAIILQGRKKEMFIRRDMNIYPGLYEPAINNIPGIKEAYLVGIQGRYGDDYIALAVKAEPGVNQSKLEKQISSILPEMMDLEALPDTVVFIKDMPVNGRANKLDRKKLEEIVANELKK